LKVHLKILKSDSSLISFSGGGEVGVILKVGDDLRQDQLILQMITLMNRLLLEEKLDLKLTPYCTLATSIDAGLMEFVPDSKGIGDILRKEGSIGKYLQECRGPRSVIMDNYVRSCAGYCVVTYILGVGDRHNDNLLITRDGKLFHVDFGFILGRDPKPMQPPLKVSKTFDDELKFQDRRLFKMSFLE
jgi:phosphatidylinositol 3-kinase